MSLGTGAGDGGGAGTSAPAGGGSTGAGTSPGAGGSPSGTSPGGSTGAPSGGTPPAGKELGGGGTATTTWRDSLPEDMRADPTLNKYSDINNLAKAHIELSKKIGEKGIFKPKVDASKEEIAAFREAMGIPSDPTKYDMGKFEGITMEDSIVDWAKKAGAENGIDPAAMKAILTDYMKVEASNDAAIEKATQEDIKAGFDGLRTEWGEAFDRNLTRANFAAQKLGGQALVDRLKEFGADNDPLILKAFSEAAKLYGEDKLRESGAGDGRQSPQELTSELAQVQSQLMALKPGDGRRPGILARWESLNRQMTKGL